MTNAQTFIDSLEPAMQPAPAPVLLQDQHNIGPMVQDTLDAVYKLLLTKNAKYGNSALDPIRMFSQASPTEQLLVRIDDKLSRIKTSGTTTPDEDTLLDLIGYLVLLHIQLHTSDS